jgi:hypothetical protein
VGHKRFFVDGRAVRDKIVRQPTETAEVPPVISALELLRQDINYQKSGRRCSSGEASRVAGVARLVSFKR